MIWIEWQNMRAEMLSVVPYRPLLCPSSSHGSAKNSGLPDTHRTVNLRSLTLMWISRFNRVGRRALLSAGSLFITRARKIAFILLPAIWPSHISWVNASRSSSRCQRGDAGHPLCFSSFLFLSWPGPGRWNLDAELTPIVIAAGDYRVREKSLPREDQPNRQGPSDMLNPSGHRKPLSRPSQS